MSTPVYGKKIVRPEHAAEVSVPQWALGAALVMYLVWSAFQVGLFNGMQLQFEKPIYVSALLGGLLLIGCAVFNYKDFKLARQLDLVSAAALLLPLVYALSLYHAVSHYTAMNMLFIQFTYAAVFITSVVLLQHKSLNHVIQNAVLATAYAIVGFGLLNWLGSWKLAGSLVGWFTDTVVSGRYTHAVMTDSNGLRLTSVFQYANTYAAFLMAFLFVALFALTRSRKWYGTLGHGFMLVPIIVSLLLTLSRGGLVLLPVVFILLLLFLKPVKQIIWIVQLGVAGIASLLIINPVTELGIELNDLFSTGAALQGWGWLLTASAAVAFLSWAVQRYAAPWLDKKLGGIEKGKGSGLWIPLGSVAAVSVLAFVLIGTGARKILPDNIAIRLENINLKQHSVLERFTFYKDALKVVRDYPLLGTGGGGWASVYEQYQNNPYISRQVHNFFLQYIIEAGIIGFVVFMGFILFIFYKYIRGYLKKDKDDFDNGFFYFILVLSILVHSLLDFNLSYTFMGMMVFLGLAGMAVAMDSSPLRPRWNKGWLRMGYLAAAGTGTLYLLFLAISHISSSNSAYAGQKLLSVSQSYEEIKTPLAKALKARPGHPESAVYLSSLDQTVFNQTQKQEFLDEAYHVITRALEDEPYNKNLLRQLVNYYDLKGEKDPAYRVYLDHAYKFSWDIGWYEELISRAVLLGEEAYVQKDAAKQQEYFSAGLEAYKHVTDGIQHLQELPPEQLQGREYFITSAIALNAARIQQLSGQAEAALATLQLGFSNGYQDVQETGKLWETDWYSAVIGRSFELGYQAYERAQQAYSLGQQELGDQETTNKQRYFKTGLDAYAHLNTDLNELQTRSGTEQQQEQLLTLTPAIRLNAGKILYLSGQLQAAADTLEPRVSDDYADAMNREMARWYLAALQRHQGIQDQAVYNQLLAADPEEAVKIEQIVNMKL
ncbi:polymerase [Paenibacillus sp. PK3_47]|uniref:O-antigen ligase family protein n=1 Tax=Paenibacillus sp. PK3_47 TaxID=2072642 RepID=UPI00201E17DC|nr:O-antigen ligase family protein [Paenibacillus sp. PK3_47]UQZ32825.1 polymerase [Paenibacillus sp. PK3_47]